VSEVTEFLVWRSALAETPRRLRSLVTNLSEQSAAVVERMVRRDVESVAHLGALLDVDASLTPLPPATDPVSEFAAGRERLLALLAVVDGSSLHREMRLADRRTLDPWRLAGELAEHDVRSLAELRRLGQGR